MVFSQIFPGATKHIHFLTSRDHRFVNGPRACQVQLTGIRICHCPHCPDDATKTTESHRRLDAITGQALVLSVSLAVWYATRKANCANKEMARGVKSHDRDQTRRVSQLRRVQNCQCGITQAEWQ